MNEILLYPIALPIIAAVLCLLLPKPATSYRKQISLITTVTTLVLAGLHFSPAAFELFDSVARVRRANRDSI